MERYPSVGGDEIEYGSRDARPHFGLSVTSCGKKRVFLTRPEHVNGLQQCNSNRLTFFSVSIHLFMAMTEDPVRSLRAPIASLTICNVDIVLVGEDARIIFCSSNNNMVW